MEPALFFGIGVLFTIAAVVVASALSDAVPRTADWGTGKRLAVAHTALILAAVAFTPLWIVSDPEPMYADLYLPYFVVPGLHIYYPAQTYFSGPVIDWSSRYVDRYPACIIGLLAWPGLVGLLVGGAQWYAIGAAWDWVARRPS